MRREDIGAGRVDQIFVFSCAVSLFCGEFVRHLQDNREEDPWDFNLLLGCVGVSAAVALAAYCYDHI